MIIKTKAETKIQSLRRKAKLKKKNRAQMFTLKSNPYRYKERKRWNRYDGGMSIAQRLMCLTLCQPFLHESPTTLTPFFTKILRSQALFFTCCSNSPIISLFLSFLWIRLRQTETETETERDLGTFFFGKRDLGTLRAALWLRGIERTRSVCMVVVVVTFLNERERERERFVRSDSKAHTWRTSNEERLHPTLIVG